MSLTDIGAGVATGGIYNAAKAAGILDPRTTTQVPLETPEQKAARQMLLQFAQTGKFGDFTAGAQVPLGYGDYGPTGIEQQGLGTLQSTLTAGIPDQYRMGDQALQDLLQTNPASIEKQFQPFSDITDRQVRNSQAAFKRSADFSGDLFSTDTIRNLGDIEAKGNESKMAQLADLTNQYQNRKLSAIPLAYQSAIDQQNAALQQVQASQQYGDLTRALNDASIKARDAELLRRRTELQMPIQAATTVAGQNTPFGVPSVTVSPYQQLLQIAGQVGGTYLGNYAGAAGYAAGSGGGQPQPAAGNGTLYGARYP